MALTEIKTGLEVMGEVPKGMERRMVHRLLIHWREAQQDKNNPSLDDVLRQDLGDIVSMIYVLRLSKEGGEPIFERISESFSEELTEDLIGKPVSQIPDGTLLSQATRYFERVLKKGVPITQGGEFTHARGDTILFRSIILPLDGEGKKITCLLGAANCKVKE